MLKEIMLTKERSGWGFYIRNINVDGSAGEIHMISVTAFPVAVRVDVYPVIIDRIEFNDVGLSNETYFMYLANQSHTIEIGVWATVEIGITRAMHTNGVITDISTLPIIRRTNRDLELEAYLLNNGILTSHVRIDQGSDKRVRVDGIRYITGGWVVFDEYGVPWITISDIIFNNTEYPRMLEDLRCLISEEKGVRS